MQIVIAEHDASTWGYGNCIPYLTKPRQHGRTFALCQTDWRLRVRN